MICLGMHSNVMLRFLVQALCSRTVYDVDQLQDGAEGGESAAGGSSASQPRQHRAALPG
jgi:hypothetical protein